MCPVDEPAYSLWQIMSCGSVVNPNVIVFWGTKLEYVRYGQISVVLGGLLLEKHEHVNCLLFPEDT